MIIPNIWKNKKCSKPPTSYSHCKISMDKLLCKFCVFHLSFPATPPMLNLVSKTKTCPQLPRSNQTNEKGVYKIFCHQILDFDVGSNIIESYIIHHHPWLKLELRRTRRVLSGTLDSGSYDTFSRSFTSFHPSLLAHI